MPMITMETAKKELYRATLLKMDDLPTSVINIFLEELEVDEGCYLPFEVGRMVSAMLDEANIEYEYLGIPSSFQESLENIMMDFNYTIEAVYSFPQLSKYKNHPLFSKVMVQLEAFQYGSGGGSGNLIELVHLPSSNFATSTRDYEREFALHDQTAFILAIQDNGGIIPKDIIEFVSQIKQSIDYISQLVMNEGRE